MIKSKLHVLMGNHKIRSVTQLAELTGLSRPTLYRIYNETGEKIEYETLDKLCRYFKCNVGDLLEFEEGDS